MTEIWKDIKDYEGLYQVSNWGRVKRENRILRFSKSSSGYLQVMLCKDGKIRNFFVHRLVAEAFIPNPFNLPEVNHKSENKQDNRVENLEYCDHKYNCNYGTRNKRTVEKIAKTVLQYTFDGILIREWESTKECGRNGFHQGAVAACCRGERKSHKGFIWKYKEV